MTRSLLLLVIILFPAMALCQDKKPTRRLTSVGIVFSPHYSYRSLNYSSSNEWVADIRDDEEVGNTSFTAGVQAHYRFGGKTRFETGLLYSNKSVKTKYEDLHWAPADASFPERSRTIYHFKYVVLPVNVSYGFFANEKMRLFAKAGLSAGVFLSKKTKVVMAYADGNDGAHASAKQVGNARFNLGATVGVGIDYRLFKRFAVRVEPFYERSLTSIVADNSAKEYLYSFGVTTGVYYSL